MNFDWAIFYFFVTFVFAAVVAGSRDADVRWVGGLIILGYIVTVAASFSDWAQHWRFAFAYDAITAAIFLRMWKEGKSWILSVASLSVLMVAAHVWLDCILSPSKTEIRLHDAIVNALYVGSIIFVTNAVWFKRAQHA